MSDLIERLNKGPAVGDLEMEIERLRAVYEAAEKLVNTYLAKPFSSAHSPLEIEDIEQLASALNRVESNE